MHHQMAFGERRHYWEPPCGYNTRSNHRKYSCKGSRRPISLMRTHNSLCARSEYHTQLAKMSFDEIFDLTAGVYFHFYKIENTHRLHQSSRQSCTHTYSSRGVVVIEARRQAKRSSREEQSKVGPFPVPRCAKCRLLIDGV